MLNTKYTSIGKLVATHGIQGQLILLHALGRKTALVGTKVLMLEMGKDNLLPYFVQATKAKTDEEIYITLEDITTKELAKPLIGKRVWLLQADFELHAAPHATVHMLGYLLYNHNVPLSHVIELIEQPHQLLAKIIYNTKEMLIPINDAFVVKVDATGKGIYLELPEGLLEVY